MTGEVIDFLEGVDAQIAAKEARVAELQAAIASFNAERDELLKRIEQLQSEGKEIE